MSKYLVMFNVYDDRYYNMFPVARINDDYGIPLLEEIRAGSAETREEISQLLLGNDKNINIYCTQNEWNQAKRKVYDNTWAIMDLDKALEYANWSNGHNRILYKDYMNGEIFESLQENGIYLVKSEEDNDSVGIPLFIDDLYLMAGTGGEFTGPYLEEDAEPADGYGTWDLNGLVSRLECHVRYNSNGYTEFERFYNARFVFKSNLIFRPVYVISKDPEEEKKPSEPASVIQNAETAPSAEPEEPSSRAEESVNGGDTIDLQDDRILSCLLPPEHDFGPYVVERSLIAKAFKAKEFKHELEVRSPMTSAEAFHYLSSNNAISDALLEQLRKQKRCRERNNCDIILSGYANKGYLVKHKLDNYGTCYTLDKRGEEAYSSQSTRKYLKITGTAYQPAEPVSSAAEAVCRLANTNVISKLLECSSISQIVSVFISRSFYTSCFNNISGKTELIIGSYEEDSKSLIAFQSFIELAHERFESLGNVYVCGLDRDQTKALVTFVPESIRDKTEGSICCYALEENVFRRADDDGQIEISSLFSVKGRKTATEETAPETVAPDYSETLKAAAQAAEEALQKAETARQKQKNAEEDAYKAEIRKAEVEKETAEIEKRRNELIIERQELETQVKSRNEELKAIASQKQKIMDDARKSLNKPEFARVVVDDYLASQLVESAARWNARQEQNEYLEYCHDLSLIPDSGNGDVVSYLIEKIQKTRPSYRKNDILNIAICMTQGLITVFSGTPGSGKTSICNIMADVLGLNMPLGEHGFVRYVPISVGRGWTSQRDFIGYYNPLTKEFDKSNQQSYDAFVIGDIENDKSRYPICILLDEANLSPMEFYWSEFIRLCDEHRSNPYINCGGKRTFFIPDTMRFLATINNDDTTTTLSPRMIDRSWIITLPELTLDDLLEKKSIGLTDGELRRVQWKELTDAFGATEMDPSKEKGINDVLRRIIDIDDSISISYRTYAAIVGYCSAAERWFGKSGTDGSDALDYAIAQRILPKIDGANSIGSNYGDTLRKLHSYLDDELGFSLSAGILAKIIERGNDVGYYQFF